MTQMRRQLTFREAIKAAELDPKWTLGFSSAHRFLMPLFELFSAFCGRS
jgi:hypothetical protein